MSAGDPIARDYFERARAWSGSGLFLAAALLAVGSFLDWVRIDVLPERIPADQASRADPFNGFDIGDGWWTLAAGIVLAACAVLLVLRPAGRWAWWAFLASVVSGGIAISDYRGITQVFRDWGGIGTGPEPGIGLTLVAIGAFVGLISSVAAIAATPRRES